MFRKIIKHYWFLIVLILLTPVLLNLLSIRLEYGLHRYYKVAGAQFDLWSDLSGLYTIAAIPLGLLSYLVVSISMRMYSRNNIKPWMFLLLLFLLLLASGISAFGNLIIDIQWSSTLRDGVGGFTMSNDVIRNIILAFSSTAFLLLYVIWRIRHAASNEVLHEQ